MEACSSHLHPETGEGPAKTVFLISLLHTIGKVFEKILLSRFLSEVSKRGLQRHEQFGFTPEHSTFYQLARLFERFSRILDEKRLTGTIFLDVA
jgi:hypothetical protein